MKTVGILLVCVALASVGGCGTASKKNPDAVGVSGTIYLDGKPLTGARVEFFTDTHSGSGETDAEGKYELVQGAVPGENKVIVTKWSPGMKLKIDPEAGIDEGQFEAAADAENTPGTKRSKDGMARQLLPPKYSDRENTTLTFPVPDDGTEKADLRLKK